MQLLVALVEECGLGPREGEKLERLRGRGEEREGKEGKGREGGEGGWEGGEGREGGMEGGKGEGEREREVNKSMF